MQKLPNNFYSSYCMQFYGFGSNESSERVISTDSLKLILLVKHCDGHHLK